MNWAELVAIKDEMRRTDREERAKDPVACPYDGTPLEYHAGKNLLHCPNGDYEVRARNQ